MIETLEGRALEVLHHRDPEPFQQMMEGAEEYPRLEADLGVDDGQVQALLDVLAPVVTLHHCEEVVLLHLSRLLQDGATGEEHPGLIETGEVLEERRSVMID